VDRELAMIKVGVDSQSACRVMQITDIFRAKIIDVQPKSLTIEITGDRANSRSHRAHEGLRISNSPAPARWPCRRK